MRKVDIVHLFIYFMIFILLSNWYINFVIVSILLMVNSIMFLFYWKIFLLINKNKKLKKQVKLLKYEKS